MSNWLKHTRCTVCGKKFLPAPFHGYTDARNPERLVCTYPCSRESERLLEEELAKKPRRKRGPKPKNKNNEEN